MSVLIGGDSDIMYCGLLFVLLIDISSMLFSKEV